MDRFVAPDLSERTALVAGATRNIGRGIAEVLGACGAFVYVTGRSTRSAPAKDPAHTVEAVAEAIEAAGGRARAVVCDHRNDDEVERLFDTVTSERGGLDVLVNNQVGWGDTPDPDGFRRRRLWQRPMSWWDENFDAGVRGHVLNCRFGFPLLLDAPAQRRGVVLFTSERAAARPADAWDAVYDLRATVAARLVALLGEQLRHRAVTAVLLYPGWTRSDEQVEQARRGEHPHPFARTEDELIANTCTRWYAGRAAAMLAADPIALELTGTLQSAHDLARRYGFTDVDGRTPDPR